MYDSNSIFQKWYNKLITLLGNGYVALQIRLFEFSIWHLLFCETKNNFSLPSESVYKIPGDDSRFYAVFTTSMNGLMGSAICTFSLEDIQAAFLGRFKEQATSSSAWLPVLTSKVPEPRPGQCVNDTQTLPGKC